jgi:opacity protein-like surface antigen
MNTRKACVGLVVTVAMCASSATPARAQSTSGAIVTGSAAASVANNGTDLAVAGSMGYRFNRVIGLGVELTWLKLKTADSSSVPDPYTSINYQQTKSDAMFFTTNVRIEIPTTSRRILPYAVGGGGVANTMVNETLTIRTLPPVPVVTNPPIGGVIQFPLPVPAPISRTQTVSTTGLGLTLGGGVSFLLTDHVSIDADLRSFYIRSNQSGSIGRFGVGASYRF